MYYSKEAARIHGRHEQGPMLWEECALTRGTSNAHALLVEHSTRPNTLSGASYSWCTCVGKSMAYVMLTIDSSLSGSKDLPVQQLVQAKVHEDKERDQACCETAAAIKQQRRVELFKQRHVP